MNEDQLKEKENSLKIIISMTVKTHNVQKKEHIKGG